MKLRKINAGLSLITTLLLVVHAVSSCVWMLSRCSIAKPAEQVSWILAGVMVLHAVFALIPAFLSRKGVEKRKCNTYPRLNLPTNIQRMTGIAMLLLLAVHIWGAANHFQPKSIHAVIHPLFFAAVLAHTSVSASKALITLGIGNAKLVKIVDTVMAVLCGTVFAAGLAGFYLCLFVGVAR